jgi:phosphoribosylamine--glycine ligase
MNVMLLGSGGREHALAWKLVQSPLLSHLFIVPGNAGTALCGTNVTIALHDFEALKKFALDNKIAMVVVGPEAPLVEGIWDSFKQDIITSDISVIGPSQTGAMLEGSKDFAKDFMNRHCIPTAAHRTFTLDTLDAGIDFIHHQIPPFVLKADGLAAGKGVIICATADEAITELNAMIRDKKFGDAGKKVIIEQYLSGIELSAFVITDGKTYKILPSAKDYKRIGEDDTGPNTGGMGSISPVPFADVGFMEKIEERIIKPTIRGLAQEKISYHGFIFFGLMNVQGNPYVIEYNVRMGDPEAECILPRVKSDLLELFISTSKGRLEESQVVTDYRYCAAFMLVSKGYPGDYEKGKEITGLDNIVDSIVFHAGSKKDEKTGKIITNGGRVLAVTSYGMTLPEALATSGKNAQMIGFEGKYYRKDLGHDLMKYI